MKHIHTATFLLGSVLVGSLFVVSHLFAQTAGGLSMSVQGTSAVVTYSKGSGSLGTDWIGIYPVGANNYTYITYQYSPGTSGILTFTNLPAGNFEARHLTSAYHTFESAPFTIGTGGGTTGGTTTGTTGNTNGTGGTTTGTSTTGGTTGSTTGGTGGTYSLSFSNSGSASSPLVSWQAPSGRSDTDWVGIYKQGADDHSYSGWQYIPASGTSGTLSFSGLNLSSGTYEARAFTKNGYTRVAVSTNTFTPGGGGTTGGTTTGGTTAGTTGGTTGGGGSYTISGVAGGGGITATWTAPSGANLVKDWIGVYKQGADNQSYLAYQYVGAVSGSITFQITTAGTYDVRYFKNNGYTRVAISGAIPISGGGTTGGTTTGGTTTGGTTTGGGTGGNPGGNPWPVKNYPSSGKNIIAFGDSLTMGVGVPQSQNYVTLLSNRLGVPITNAGVSGDDTARALARVDRDVTTQNPKVVIVFLGGNDELRRMYEKAISIHDDAYAARIRAVLVKVGANLTNPPLTTDQTFANLTQIITKIQAKGSVVIVVGLGGGILEPSLNDHYKDVARNTQSGYVPDALKGILGNPFLSSDFLHPNATGYSILADRIELILRSVSNP